MSLISFCSLLSWSFSLYPGSFCLYANPIVRQSNQPVDCGRQMDEDEDPLLPSRQLSTPSPPPPPAAPGPPRCRTGCAAPDSGPGDRKRNSFFLSFCIRPYTGGGIEGKKKRGSWGPGATPPRWGPGLGTGKTNTSFGDCFGIDRSESL